MPPKSSPSVEKERRHPHRFILPTPEEVEKGREHMVPLLAARLQRLGMRVPIFNKWVQDRQAAVRTDPDLGPAEEPRLEDIEMFIAEIKDTFKVCKIENIFIAKLIKHCTLVKNTNPLVPKHATHVGSFILTDCDDVPFLMLFEDGLNEVGRGASNSRIESLNIAADKEYEEEFAAYVLKKEDERHTSEYHKGRRHYCEDQGLPFGGHHNGILSGQGQCFNQLTKNGGLYCQTIAGDTTDGKSGSTGQAERARASQTWLRKTARRETILGLIYKVFAPDKFAEAKAHRDEFVNAGMLTKESGYECWNLVAEVVNDPVSAHTDIRDARRGMAARVCHGDSPSGLWCLPILGVALNELPGDVLIMNAAIIQHCVRDFIGLRTSYILTNKIDKYGAKQHRSYMNESEGKAFDEERARKVAKKAADDAKAKSSELDLAAAHFGDSADISSGSIVLTGRKFPSFEDDFNLSHVPCSWRRLAGAVAAKAGESKP